MTEFFSEETAAHESEEKLSGTVEEIIFQNAQNGYTVLVLSCENLIYTLSGTMPEIAEGMNITAYGKFKKHPDYGEQFSVSCYEASVPSDESEIEAYLASGILPHIGRATARKIVERFGKSSLSVIENEPERLTEIKGLSKKKSEEINKKYLEQIGIKEIIIFFQKFGITPHLAAKAFKILGAGTVNLVRQNPYILSDSVSGFSFSTADEIAAKLDFPKNSPERIKACLKHTLMNAAYSGGHTFLPVSVLLGNTRAMLGIEADEVYDALSSLLMEKALIKENHDDFEVIYHKTFYDAEKTVAEIIKDLSYVL